MDQELIDYLDRHFDKVNHRFEQMEGRFEWMEDRFEQMEGRFERVEKLVEQNVEVIRRNGVMIENLESQLKLVAEGVANVDEKLDRFRAETDGRFKETLALMRTSDHALRDRVERAERRVDRIEGHLGRMGSGV